MKKNRKLDEGDIICTILLVCTVIWFALKVYTMLHPETKMNETKVVDGLSAASSVIVDVGTGLSVQD